MGFFDDIKFFFGKRRKEPEYTFTHEDWAKLELQMRQMQQNINTPQLSESEKIEWIKVLKMLREPPYNLLHMWYSVEEGWCYISGNGKRQKLSFTDSIERIKTLCDIIMQ